MKKYLWSNSIEFEGCRICGNVFIKGEICFVCNTK
jgi:hypothetical protein